MKTHASRFIEDYNHNVQRIAHWKQEHPGEPYPFPLVSPRTDSMRLELHDRIHERDVDWLSVFAATALVISFALFLLPWVIS